MESRQSFLTVQERGVTYVRANPAAPYTNGEKARRLAMVTLTLMTIAAACLIVGGYGGKATNLAVKQANTAPVIHRTMRLDEEAEADAAPAEADAAPAEDGSSIPDPEEAKKKAAEALKKASGFAGEAFEQAGEAVQAYLPEGFDVIRALGWHLDICFYVATAYTVYYIWLNQVWVKIFPRFKWREPTEATEKTVNKDNKQCKIGQWVEAGVDATDEKGDPTAPSDQDLLWFRQAEGEEFLFCQTQLVMPALMDMIMCGCGGNHYAVAVTNKRIIIQNDRRCLFGTTPLTTNEESYFIKHVHKANLNTDGCLNLGICKLHSAEMLSGGFNWIAMGFIVDLILEWKPTAMAAFDDARIKGWINMVPDDVIYMFSSALVLFGVFLFAALLFFLMCPQSVLEVEMVKQAGTKSYSLKFEYPVRLAYKMHDAIMQGRFGKGTSKELVFEFGPPK